MIAMGFTELKGQHNLATVHYANIVTMLALNIINNNFSFYQLDVLVYVTGFDKTRLPRTRTEIQFMV